MNLPQFSRYIGIDYSGAGNPEFRVTFAIREVIVNVSQTIAAKDCRFTGEAENYHRIQILTGEEWHAG